MVQIGRCFGRNRHSVGRETLPAAVPAVLDYNLELMERVSEWQRRYTDRVGRPHKRYTDVLDCMISAREEGPEHLGRQDWGTLVHGFVTANPGIFGPEIAEVDVAFLRQSYAVAREMCSPEVKAKCSVWAD